MASGSRRCMAALSVCSCPMTDPNSAHTQLSLVFLYFKTNNIYIILIVFKHSSFNVMYLLSIDWWRTNSTRSNVVTRNYMQTNMPGKYM